MKQTRYPTGWNKERVRKLLRHYETQTEDEAVAEDEAAFRRRNQTVMVVPKALVPAITRMIATEGKRKQSVSRRSIKPAAPDHGHATVLNKHERARSGRSR